MSSAVAATPPGRALEAAPDAHADRLTSAPTRLDADVLRALRTATTLGMSLVGTWSIALAVRILLPRRLGPALFGEFQFAEAFTEGVSVLAWLGIETYARKELATRREHATDFYGGQMVLRMLLTAGIMLGSFFALRAAGRSPVTLQLVLILGTAQFFVGQNGTVAAMLHAVGEVDGLSLLNIAGKLFWAVAVAAALLTGGGVQLVAFSFAASEGLKLITMHMLARRHLAVRMRIHPRRTCTVVVASLPFFVAGISQTLYSRVDTTMLSFLASDVEVGWYGAAATVSGMAMLLAPLLTWVLLPLSARAGARSDADVTLLVRRAMSLVIALALPVTLGIGLGADVIVHTLFGAAYAPATLSLQTMAPVFLFTYVGMVSGGTLIGLGRGWLVTTVMLGSLGLLPLLGWLLIPWGHTTLGAGGAGAGAAAALNITEACVAVALSVALGRRVVHRHGAVLLARNLAACVAVAALDRLVLASLGPARLIVDAAVYVALVVLWKAADYQELFVLAKRAFSRAKTPSTDETAESNGI